MPGSLLGNRVLRVEDPDLLLGRATFVSNLALSGCLEAAFVRSPHAHARLLNVDVSGALDLPGVVGAYSASDLDLPELVSFMELNEHCRRPPLARTKVRFAGEPVAVVVAHTLAAAVDAAEHVVVDYEVLPPAVSMVDACADTAPLQFEAIGTNVVAGFRDPPARDPFEHAVTVVRAQLENQRVAVVPLETDAVAAVPGDAHGEAAGGGHELTVYVSTQMPHAFADDLATYFGLDRQRVRVVAPHVGGAFGSKVGLGAEHAVVTALARRLGRPVRWIQTRAEGLTSMPDGRGQTQWVEIGLDAHARITGLHARVLCDAGAYAGFGGALGLGSTRMMMAGVYTIPVVVYDVATVVTNTTPMGAFRGAGRPEAAELLERMMDIAAATIGMDPVELRRRNLRPAFSEPVTTVMGTTYDTGDYAKALDRVLQLADYTALVAERAERRSRHERWQLGIGVSLYVEVTAGAGDSELGVVQVHPDGTATVKAGTSAHGQGHATAYSMIVSDLLGIPIEAIRFIQSDTASVDHGGGTGGSRSLQLAGSAVVRASHQVLERARLLAARALEASPDDMVVHADGARAGLIVAGMPSSMLTWAQLAQLAERGDGDEGGGGSGEGTDSDGGSGGGEGGEPLAASVDFSQRGATFPFGAHLSVVEVDTETGAVRPIRHIAVDDCGRVLNPLLVTGQQHGGVVQGMSQALWEEKLFDAAGNPVNASLADYGMPSAAEVPALDTASVETPTFMNPLGAKGVGESPTVGSTPAVHNAVVDALSFMGVRHIAMPCTPERVWRAIQAARAGGPEAAGGGRALWSPPPPAFDRLPDYDKANHPEADGVEV